jgi:hypothetical protein
MIELFSVYSVEIMGILSNILLLFFILKAWRLDKEIDIRDELIDERDELIHDYRKKITIYEKRYFNELYEIADEWSKNFRKKRG